MYGDILQKLRQKEARRGRVDLQWVKQTKKGSVVWTFNVQRILRSNKRGNREERHSTSYSANSDSIIQGLDSIKEAEDVHNALNLAFPGGKENGQVFVTNANTAYQAIVVLSDSEVNNILNTTRIKIVWINYRVRKTVTV